MTQVFCQLEKALVVVVPLEEELLIVLGRILAFHLGVHRRAVSCCVGVRAVPGCGRLRDCGQACRDKNNLMVFIFV